MTVVWCWIAGTIVASGAAVMGTKEPTIVALGLIAYGVALLVQT